MNGSILGRYDLTSADFAVGGRGDLRPENIMKRLEGRHAGEKDVCVHMSPTFQLKARLCMWTRQERIWPGVVVPDCHPLSTVSHVTRTLSFD